MVFQHAGTQLCIQEHVGCLLFCYVSTRCALANVFLLPRLVAVCTSRPRKGCIADWIVLKQPQCVLSLTQFSHIWRQLCIGLYVLLMHVMKKKGCIHSVVFNIWKKEIYTNLLVILLWKILFLDEEDFSTIRKVYLETNSNEFKWWSKLSSQQQISRAQPSDMKHIVFWVLPYVCTSLSLPDTIRNARWCFRALWLVCSFQYLWEELLTVEFFRVICSWEWTGRQTM